MAGRVIPAFAPEAIDSALDVLRRGGLVAFPTDTVYGVGAMALDPAAIERIYTAKGRDASKALPILLAGLAGLAEVVQALPPEILRLAGGFLPGPPSPIVAKLG